MLLDTTRYVRLLAAAGVTTGLVCRDDDSHIMRGLTYMINVAVLAIVVKVMASTGWL